jgi:hypothetical protein
VTLLILDTIPLDAKIEPLESSSLLLVAVGEGTLPLHHLISYFTPRKLKHITSFTTARQKNKELPDPIIPRPPPMKP